MEGKLNPLHFVLIPFMSPGHIIPMVDLAKSLCLHGVMVTIVTTPLNAVRYIGTIKRAVDSGLHIQILQLQFNTVQAGLPDGCENMDQLPSRNLMKNFFDAVSMLQQPFEEQFETLKPRPHCIISVSKEHEKTVSKFEPFSVPGLFHPIKLTRAQLPETLANAGSPEDLTKNIRATERATDGIVVNTLDEIETEYVKEYRRIKGGNVWCIGPVSAINKLEIDKAERGENKIAVDDSHIHSWLDSHEPHSVVYACLGSKSSLTATQIKELGFGLEQSNGPFIWVIRSGGRNNSEKLENWIIEFKQRIKNRGLIIQGWAPQVLILSHPAIGGFLTHCGWNSTLEGLTAGIPMMTCPLFAEQFYNDKLLVEVLETSVSVGVEAAVTWGHEDKFVGLVMKREGVREAVERVMEKSEESEKRRRKAKEIGKIANEAVEGGGSSYRNMESLIRYVLEQSKISAT